MAEQFNQAAALACIGNLASYLICLWIRVRARRIGAAEQILWIQYCERARNNEAARFKL